MIYINKKNVPKVIQERVIKIKAMESWKRLDCKDTKGKRNHFEMLDKQSIREALFEEQHGICAYCMRRITPDETMIIEHFIPLASDEDKNSAIDYANMLGTCDGGRHFSTKQSYMCCDASKGNIKISINPLDKSTLGNLRYDRYGFIRTIQNDEEIMNDIENVLHLNGVRNQEGKYVCDTSTQIVAGRKATYDACQKYIKKQAQKYNGEKFIRVLKKKVEELMSEQIYDEFIGVKIYCLNKRIRAGAR